MNAGRLSLSARRSTPGKGTRCFPTTNDTESTRGRPMLAYLLFAGLIWTALAILIGFCLGALIDANREDQ